MKNFIQLHPYLSCLGVVGLSTAFTTITSLITHTFLAPDVPVMIAFATLSAMFPTINQFRHQKFSDNEALQYGLTALKGLAGNFLLSKIKYGSNYSDDLTKISLSENSIMAKLFFISAGVQAVAFKYILDSAKEAMKTQDDPLDSHYDGIEEAPLYSL